MDVSVADRQKRLPRSGRIVGAMTRRIVVAEAPDVDEVSVVLGDDALLASLNEMYRGKPRPTDVLAFPSDSLGPHRHIGEVIISTDRAIAQAPRYRHDVADELTRLLVHGLLHLLGYEHDTSAGRRRMRLAERAHVERLRAWIERLRGRLTEIT